MSIITLMLALMLALTIDFIVLPKFILTLALLPFSLKRPLSYASLTQTLVLVCHENQLGETGASEGAEGKLGERRPLGSHCFRSLG